MGSIRYSSRPILLVTAEMALKADERRALRSPQQAFEFAAPQGTVQLRVTTAAANDLVSGSDLAIRRNMRIPSSCVLARVYAEDRDVTVAADEDQCEWETSRAGPLLSLPIHVEAVRRGRFVYGLISTTGNDVRRI
jgi:hypothetical protein